MTYQQELKNQRIKNVQDTVEKMVNEYGVKETTNPTQKKNGTRQFLFPGGASLATYKSGYVRRIGGYGDWQINNVVKTTQIYYYVNDNSQLESYRHVGVRRVLIDNSDARMLYMWEFAKRNFNLIAAATQL